MLTTTWSTRRRRRGDARRPCSWSGERTTSSRRPSSKAAQTSSPARPSRRCRGRVTRPTSRPRGVERHRDRLRRRTRLTLDFAGERAPLGPVSREKMAVLNHHIVPTRDKDATRAVLLRDARARDAETPRRRVRRAPGQPRHDLDFLEVDGDIQHLHYTFAASPRWSSTRSSVGSATAASSIGPTRSVTSRTRSTSGTTAAAATSTTRTGTCSRSLAPVVGRDRWNDPIHRSGRRGLRSCRASGGTGRLGDVQCGRGAGTGAERGGLGRKSATVFYRGEHVAPKAAAHRPRFGEEEETAVCGVTESHIIGTSPASARRRPSSADTTVARRTPRSRPSTRISVPGSPITGDRRGFVAASTAAAIRARRDVLFPQVRLGGDPEALGDHLVHDLVGAGADALQTGVAERAAHRGTRTCSPRRRAPGGTRRRAG